MVTSFLRHRASALRSRKTGMKDPKIFCVMPALQCTGQRQTVKLATKYSMWLCTLTPSKYLRWNENYGGPLNATTFACITNLSSHWRSRGWLVLKPWRDGIRKNWVLSHRYNLFHWQRKRDW